MAVSLPMNDLAIKDLAERTGIAPGTIRMWEQRYGFPEPARTASGYRRYTVDDVEALRRIASYRRVGLSIPAAIERVRSAETVTDRPSLYAAVASLDPAARPQVLRKPTLTALSRAIEDEALARAASPVLFAAFQRPEHYRPVSARYRRLAAHADAATVFASFGSVRRPRGGPVELPIDLDDAIGNEWAVIVDAPGYCACLLAWEHPADGPADRARRFEAIWTVQPQATRRAAQVAARLAGQIDPAYGSKLDALLAGRPLAVEDPAPALTALANRAIAYVEEAR
ncbi:MAG TPA: DICT sensory domain-containing protein [Solirubrobacteraceae bacterium]|jgi:DICT domain-containing protein